MLSILNDRLAAGNGFFKSNSSVSVVCIGTRNGVLRDMFGSWLAARLQAAFIPKIVVDAAQSMYAAVMFGFGGLAQPGGSS